MAEIRLANSQNSSPENPVFDVAMAYQKTAALVAAVKLDIFTVIGSGAMTSNEIASRTDASPRGIRILCDFMTTIKFLNKDGSWYSLTPSARILLDGTSPFAMGSIVHFISAPEMIALFLEDPAEYVRRGGAIGRSNVAPDNPIWIQYARAMEPLASTVAKRVAAYVGAFPEPPLAVLDIAAGHGLYGIEVAKVAPEAIVTGIDWGGVLEVAKANARRAGVSDRYRALTGDALTTDWGSNFDLIMLPNFLHHFDKETCISLLGKVRKSLAMGGVALSVDFVPDENRVSPPVAAMFAFWMLASTPGGDAYTSSELDQMARSAGFLSATVRSLAPTPESLVIFES
jgi:ubiquinone/menaquinone biosynthesis C-methylase UbiE